MVSLLVSVFGDRFLNVETLVFSVHPGGSLPISIVFLFCWVQSVLAYFLKPGACSVRARSSVMSSERGHK